ncbi:MAG: hypothetical protein WCD18_03740 [Thermosynechococcaceae cyanobacterium]
MTPQEIQAAFEAQLQINQAISRDVAILVKRQQATDEGLDRLTNITERYINASTSVIERLDQSIGRLDQSIEELRASNRRQERINDFLLRRETGEES